MWNNVDKLLEKYYKEYKKGNKYLQDNLQKVFDSINFNYNQLYDATIDKELMKFKRTLEQEQEKVEKDSYIYFMIDNYLKMKKIRNIDMLKFLIYLEYYHFKQNMDEYERELFHDVVYDAYEQAEEEIKPQKKILDIPNIILLGLNNYINNLGYEWKEYIDGIVKYNSEELSRQIVMNISSNKKLNIDDIEFQKLLTKQEKRQINMHDNRSSGAIENQVDNIFNYSKLETGKQYNVKQCRFIAEMDNKTTIMCETLNNQIFNIDDWNTYSRYSEIDKKNIIYKTFGLKLGDNLPPINNHFHWCRSTITYQLEINSDNIKNIIYNSNLFEDNIINEDFKGLNKKVEHLFIYDAYTGEKILEVHQNKKSSVGGLKPVLIAMRSKPNSLVMSHNHPSNSSFSFNDIDTFNRYDSIDSIVVKTEKYLYYLEKNDITKINPKELKEIYYTIKKENIALYGKNIECFHITNMELSKKVGWNYGRIPNK